MRGRRTISFRGDPTERTGNVLFPVLMVRSVFIRVPSFTNLTFSGTRHEYVCRLPLIQIARCEFSILGCVYAYAILAWVFGLPCLAWWHGDPYRFWIAIIFFVPFLVGPVLSWWFEWNKPRPPDWWVERNRRREARSGRPAKGEEQRGEDKP